MDSLAPRVTPLLTSLIYDTRLSAPLLRSFLRLFAAAWMHDYRATDPLDFEYQLPGLLGLSAAQVYRHIQLLRSTGFQEWRTDGHQRYTFSFPALVDPETAQLYNCTFPESVVGVNRFNINNIKDSQQQHTTSQTVQMYSSGVDQPPAAAPGETQGSPETGAPQPHPSQPDDPTQRFVLDCLARAGVWSDVARRISEQVCASQRLAEPHLPGVADVLGWMAYCFGGQHKNNINAPAAVLAHNLTSGRRCPENLRPQPICARCRYEHRACTCPDGPQDTFPPEFIDAAFKEHHYDYTTTRWGVCKTCRAMPCQCEQ